MDLVSKQREALLAGVTTLIYQERKEPRQAHVLQRGAYDQPGDAVTRRTPSFLPAMPEGLPRNRLGLAEWTVSARNPLTARVTVNRFWQQFFGVGLVATAEDFGSQGEPPTHPELLDWLAADFVESGWDVKRLMRSIATSRAYRQSSVLTSASRRADPGNRLISRGPRVRLDAEAIRDQALSVSGLLVEQIGGPPVRPPQPAGLWKAVGYSSSDTAEFVADLDDHAIHRRSLYTFLKRTAPPPQMAVFDGPNRESCVVRRERTNTPLQALLLMNDPQFVEAARALAQRVLREASADERARAALLVELTTCRPPRIEEIVSIVEGVHTELKHYRQNPEEAVKLLSVARADGERLNDPAELAAWTMAASMTLNLDEVLSKN